MRESGIVGNNFLFLTSNKKVKLTEADLQKQCVRYLALQYPHVLFHHSPNEGKRTPAYWNWLKALGTKPGFPDLIIFESRKVKNSAYPQIEYKGLIIELKIGRAIPTENQAFLLKQFKDRGYYCWILNNYDAFKKVVDDYLRS